MWEVEVTDEFTDWYLKSGDWQGWYEQAIPEAERIYEQYLAELRKEGLLP